MNMKGVKCFKCKQKGHLAKFCPGSKKPHCWVGLEESIVEIAEEGDEEELTTDKAEEPDPWLLSVTTGGKDNGGTHNTGGPTYKADIAVKEVKVRTTVHRSLWCERSYSQL